MCYRRDERRHAYFVESIDVGLDDAETIPQRGHHFQVVQGHSLLKSLQNQNIFGFTVFQVINDLV